MLTLNEQNRNYVLHAQVIGAIIASAADATDAEKKVQVYLQTTCKSASDEMEGQ